MEMLKKYLPTLTRVLLGLSFVVFGLNGLFNFLPMPPMEEAGASFIGDMMDTGYLWQLLKVVEVLAGLMLLSGRMVMLGLLMLAPVLTSIVTFHIVLAPSGLMLAGMLAVLYMHQLYVNRDTVLGLVKA